MTATENAVKAAASFSEAAAAHSAGSARTAVELQSDYVVIIFGNGVQSWLESWFYQSQRFCTTAHTYIDFECKLCTVSRKRIFIILLKSLHECLLLGDDVLSK